MGIIFTRFQKKPTTRDILQKIQQEIQEIEDHKWSTIRKERNYASLLFFISLSLLIVFIGIFLYYLPRASGWRDKILLSVPIIALSLFVWLLKKTLQWYCRWSLDTKETKLRELQKEKGRILDQVQETETFNVATELLEKYDPKRLRKVNKLEMQEPQQAASYNSKINPRLSSIETNSRRESQGPRSVPLSNTSFANTSFHLHEPLSTINDNNESIDGELNEGATNQQQTTLRKRQSIATSVPQPVKPPIQRNQTGPSMDVSILNQTVSGGISSYNQQVQNMAQLQVQSQAKPLSYQQTPVRKPLRNINTPIIATSSVPGRPVRPVLSKERTFFEKVVDWVVADGPTNRFALICKYCYGHNGMALQEEFESLNFRCCYCCNLNTTHKHKLRDNGSIQEDERLQQIKQEETNTTSTISTTTTQAPLRQQQEEHNQQQQEEQIQQQQQQQQQEKEVMQQQSHERDEEPQRKQPQQQEEEKEPPTTQQHESQQEEKAQQLEEATKSALTTTTTMSNVELSPDKQKESERDVERSEVR